ncbi:hypothetical protein DY000_02059792, partial [Brassica cretica]
FVFLGFSSVGMCSESDALIKTYVPSPRSDELIGSVNLKVPSITVDDWDSLVLESKVTVMIMFTATWCGSCGQMSFILDQLDSDYRGSFKFYTVDVINDQFIADQYSVRDLPTTIIFKDGEKYSFFHWTSFSEEIERTRRPIPVTLWTCLEKTTEKTTRSYTQTLARQPSDLQNKDAHVLAREELKIKLTASSEIKPKSTTD